MATRARMALAAALAGLVAWPAAGQVQDSQNIDAGKTPAQLYSQSCALCHKSVGDLKKSGRATPGFLRQHYSASREEAAALASFVQNAPASVDRAAPARRQPPPITTTAAPTQPAIATPAGPVATPAAAPPAVTPRQAATEPPAATRPSAAERRRQQQANLPLTRRQRAALARREPPKPNGAEPPEPEKPAAKLAEATASLHPPRAITLPEDTPPPASARPMLPEDTPLSLNSSPRLSDLEE